MLNHLNSLSTTHIKSRSCSHPLEAWGDQSLFAQKQRTMMLRTSTRCQTLRCHLHRQLRVPYLLFLERLSGSRRLTDQCQQLTAILAVEISATRCIARRVVHES